MTLVRETVRNAAVGVGVANTAKGLSALHHAGCAAVIWRRRPDPGFRNWIDALDPGQLPRARIVLRSDQVAEALVQVCDLAEMPDGTHRAALIEDAAALSDAFSNAMRAPYLRLRLDVINTNACRRFHVDAVSARMICTYRGTGTQYGVSTDGEQPRRVFTVPTGSPIVLRGSLWPDVPKTGLLHRSPPIEGTGESRLVLVLDPLSDTEGTH